MIGCLPQTTLHDLFNSTSIRVECYPAFSALILLVFDDLLALYCSLEQGATDLQTVQLMPLPCPHLLLH